MMTTAITQQRIVNPGLIDLTTGVLEFFFVLVSMRFPVSCCVFFMYIHFLRLYKCVRICLFNAYVQAAAAGVFLLPSLVLLLGTCHLGRSAAALDAAEQPLVCCCCCCCLTTEAAPFYVLYGCSCSLFFSFFFTAANQCGCAIVVIIVIIIVAVVAEVTVVGGDEEDGCSCTSAAGDDHWGRRGSSGGGTSGSKSGQANLKQKIRF